MIRSLNSTDFLSQSYQRLMLDVRSEAEYAYGHIPRAVNLPLFNNEERKIIGTCYKQQSREAALLEGLDIVGKKMSDFVRFVQPLVKDRKIFIHCWRGGMRSSSMAWLFDLFGYDVFTLEGGYKSYRHSVLQTIEQARRYFIVGGKTGSGKTALLYELKKRGEQMIDLEHLANHKGSAFGMLGQPPQPSTEYFENLLADELKKLDSKCRIWLEDESKKIGTVILNNQLWQYMKSAPLYVIELPQEVRVKRLVADYAENHHEGLKQSLTAIKKRLGGLDWKLAMDALAQNDYASTARIALHYYDKTYEHCIAQHTAAPVIRFDFEKDNLADIADTLIHQAHGKN